MAATTGLGLHKQQQYVQLGTKPEPGMCACACECMHSCKKVHFSATVRSQFSRGAGRQGQPARGDSAGCVHTNCTSTRLPARCEALSLHPAACFQPSSASAFRGVLCILRVVHCGLTSPAEAQLFCYVDHLLVCLVRAAQRAWRKRGSHSFSCVGPCTRVVRGKGCWLWRSRGPVGTALGLNGPGRLHTETGLT